MIHLDSREPKGLQMRMEGAIRGKGKVVNVCPLDSADVMLFDREGHSLGIERKTIGDMLNSLSSHRLHHQLTRMCESYTHCALAIEGAFTLTPEGFIKVGFRPTGWRFNAVQMILWGIQKSGVTILYVPTERAYIDLVRSIHDRAAKSCVLPGNIIEVPGFSG